MKGIITWALAIVSFIVLGITGIAVYYARGLLPTVGVILLVSVATMAVLLPCFLVVFLARFILKVDKFDPGPFGAYLRLYNKMIPLKPLSQEFPPIDTTTTVLEEESPQTRMLQPSEKSRDYLGYEKIYQILRNAGINLDQPEEEKEVDTGPILHVVGGTDPQLNDELSRALRFYDSGNRSRNDMAACLKCTPHHASHVITQLRAKGLVK